MARIAHVFAFVVLTAGRTTVAQSTASDTAGVIGRWDLTVRGSAGTYPSWLEVRKSGRQSLVGQFVGRFGSARPIAKVAFDHDTLSFSVPPQWENQTTDITVVGWLANGHLTGFVTDSAGNKLSWTADRAPALRRAAEPSWGKETPLFNGATLAGWHVIGDSQWRVVGGVLTNAKAGGNIVTDSSFDDFKLHVEFRYPKGGNSGVYLRGRYEAQIEDSRGLELASDHLGGIYGFVAPSADAAKGPGEWQTYDITLVGRMVTVVLNGKTVICNREIPGITGGALDSNESAPGPIFLQGDHGPVEFRRIMITRAVSAPGTGP